MQQGLSIEQVAQLLHGFNAARPSEHALQEELRTVKEDNLKLQGRLLQ